MPQTEHATNANKAHTHEMFTIRVRISSLFFSPSLSLKFSFHRWEVVLCCKNPITPQGNDKVCLEGIIFEEFENDRVVSSLFKIIFEEASENISSTFF